MRWSSILTVLLLACADPPTGADAPVPDAGMGDVGSGDDTGEAIDSGATDGGTLDAGADTLVERIPVEDWPLTCSDAPTDYGTFGAVTEIDRHELPNPAWAEEPVVVFAPVDDAASRPVVFFSHPYGGTDWRRERAIFQQLASHGFVVVFTPYPTTGMSVCGRYTTLSTGFEEAVRVLGARLHMDTTRVGFAGHSFGGGASPAMARLAIERGWGSAGSFVFSSAPWFVYWMDEPGAWESIAGVPLVVMVYADDPVNDHRMAIDDLYAQHMGPRTFLRLHGDASGACTLVADHGVPQTVEGIDALDAWGFMRHLHALAECELRGDAAACAVVTSTEMGTFTSGAPVEPVETTDTPEPSRASADYIFPVTDPVPCER